MASERVVENSSSPDVSQLWVVEGRVGTIKAEFAFIMSETKIGGVCDGTLGYWKLKRGEASSGEVTDEEDGEGGGTEISCGLRDDGIDERRIS